MSPKNAIMAVSALVLIGFVPAAAYAQDASPAHSGGWVALGIGAGNGNYNCDWAACGAGSLETVPSGHLAFGGTITPNLLVGIGAYAWVNIVETLGTGGAVATTDNEIIGWLVVDAYFYPLATIDFYLHGAAGLSTYHLDTDGTVFAESRAPGFIAGAGIDLGPFGVFANYMVGPSQDVEVLGIATNQKIDFNVLQFGVALQSR